MPDKKYSKEQLEKSRSWFLEPKIESSISYALKNLQEGDMAQFLQTTSVMTKEVEHHIMSRCAKAENEDLRIDCVTKAENIRIRTLNKLGEALADKCGEEMHYLEELK